MIGRMFRQYLVTAHLGQGGMGEVWKARDTVLERDVALKILPTGDASLAERKERFIREARAASALNHPSIITIYEINTDQDVDFIAMEYVRGATLAAVIRQGPMAIDRVVRYALQIAEAVGRAHSAGIVHRDLKPGNIMVTDEDDLVKVLDFGLAKVGRTPEESAADSSDIATQMALTRVGTSVGTIGYMSPEQAIGDVVDARSDVFSFGVIVYEMFAGVLPFAARSPLEILHELHLKDPPPLESVRPDTPAAITAIVSRMLAKKPGDRYANLTQVATALRMSLSSAPSSAQTAIQQAPGRPPAVPQSRPWRRLALVMGAIVAVIGTVAAIAWRSRQPAPDAANTASVAINDTAGPFELTRDAAVLLVRQDREENVDRAIAMLERAVSLDQSFAPAYAHLAEAYIRKHRTRTDEQWLRQAREAAQRAVALNADLAAGHQALGFVQLEAGERAEAAVEFRRAADLDPVNPFPHVGLGLVFVAQNQDTEADAAFQEAIRLGPREWRPLVEYGQFFFRKARYQEAVEQWERARQVTPDNVPVLRSLGAAYYLLDRPDEAASQLQRALEVRPSASTYTNLGTIRFFQGRYTEAVATFEKAVELAANNHGYWGNLGDGYRWAPGRRGDAPAAYRRASQLIQELVAKQPDNPDLRSRHGLYLIKMGDTRAALESIGGLAGRTDLNAQMWYRIAVIHELAGDRGQALGSLERALKGGYPVKDLKSEPELVAMRADARYHRLIDGAGVMPPKP